MKKIIIFGFTLFGLTFVFINEVAAQRFRLEEYSNQEIDLQFDTMKVDQSIRFVWSTSSQANIQTYELKKGKENGLLIDWETIVSVQAGENKKAYEFTDQNPRLGEMHYRLKLLAADGSSFEYSPIFRVSQKE